MYELRNQKNELRAEYLKKRSLIDPEDKAQRDERICNLFLSLVTYRYSELIMTYSPIDHEIDVSRITLRALEAGKIVAFPRCEPEGRRMTFYRVTDLSQLKRGSYGILEPDPTLPIVEPAAFGARAVCLVPAVVYDIDGYRLGYGKGYYDRYLTGFKGTKVGVIYGDFMLDRVPRGRFDLSADVLITDKGVRAINAR